MYRVSQTYTILAVVYVVQVMKMQTISAYVTVHYRLYITDYMIYITDYTLQTALLYIPDYNRLQDCT